MTINNLQPTILDMATVVKIIPPFTGSSNENPSTWLRRVELISASNNISEVDTLRLIAWTLQDKAADWYADVVSKANYLSLPDFKDVFIARFTNSQVVEKIWQNFIKIRQISSSEQYFSILRDLTRIADVKSFTVETITRNLVIRCPPALAAALSPFTNVGTTWQQFLQVAEDKCWIAFPENLPSNTPYENDAMNNACPMSTYPRGLHQSYKAYRSEGPSRFVRKPKCIVHPKSSHSTEECESLKRAVKMGQIRLNQKTGQANSIGAEDTEKDLEINKNIDLYSTRTFKKTPFRVPVYIEDNIRAEALIDTGADANLIKKHLVPRQCRLITNNLKVMTANGQTIGINKEAKNIPINIQNSRLNIDALVTKEGNNDLILGSDFILKNPSIISNIIAKNATDSLAGAKHTCCTNLSALPTLDSIIKKYENIFQTEISQYCLCSTYQHSIVTTSEKPISVHNQRLPIHLEQQIDEEIKKNLRLGIIRPSNSSWSSRLVPVKKKDNSLRLCVDFRPLNNITVKDKYPIPRIDDIIDSLSQARIFTTLDATSGYFQIAMNPEDSKENSFCVQRRSIRIYANALWTL